MTNTEELKEDIAYVRAAADRSDTNPIPSIYLLWAAIGLCGFALVDFTDDYRWIGGYWLVSAPAGFCLSMWLGIRASHLPRRERHDNRLPVVAGANVRSEVGNGRAVLLGGCPGENLRLASQL